MSGGVSVGWLSVGRDGLIDKIRKLGPICCAGRPSVRPGGPRKPQTILLQLLKTEARAIADDRRRARVDLTPEVSSLLDEAAGLFGLSRAETLRRVIRASIDVGPALSADNTRTVAALASQIRMVGRNLSQLVHAIHAGRAVSMQQALPIWEALDARISAIDGELTAMTVAHGMRLRRSAHLPDLDP